jgi:YrbI family 3-deoxy-D-manno-octulosonate 8-phosphate phosphatase
MCIIVPARYASSRLYGKIMMKLNGLPIIHHTFNKTMQSEIVDKNDIYIFTDNKIIKDYMDPFCDNVFITGSCNNGTERISKNIHFLKKKYDLIINIQADEPLIDPRNIDFAILKHLENINNKEVFYTTLHQKIDDNDYLNSQECLTVQINKFNDVITYSRNVLPGNKKGVNNINKFDYYGFTGIYVFNPELLKIYHQLEDTKYQLFEDIEQMKIIENNYKIKSYECSFYNEISINSEKDLEYVCKKYELKTDYDFSENKKIKLVAFDLDGVFTDGKIDVNENGVITKRYNGKDSYGLKLLNDKNIKTVLITAHDSDTTRNMNHIISRMDKVIIGKYDKLTEMDKIVKEFELDYSEIAYIGDDLPDVDILKRVGLSGCPSNAVDDVKNICNFKCKNIGGDGAVREFIDYILKNSVK